jgi:hypothetical protein
MCVHRFVLSALGLYSVAPGTEEYVLGSPIFKHVRIKLPSLDAFRLASEGSVTDGLPARDIHIVALGPRPWGRAASESQFTMLLMSNKERRSTSKS